MCVQWVVQALYICLQCLLHASGRIITATSHDGQDSMPIRLPEKEHTLNGSCICSYARVCPRHFTSAQTHSAGVYSIAEQRAIQQLQRLSGSWY